MLAVPGNGVFSRLLFGTLWTEVLEVDSELIVE
jgi:hypothetical protein